MSLRNIKTHAGILCGSLIVITMLHACVISKYKRPDLNLPEAYRNDTTAIQLSDSGIATIPYRSFFQDPVLLTLIDSGMQRNYDLLIAVKQIEYSEQAMKQAKWNNIPAISFTAAQASINRPSDNSLNGLTASSFLGQSYIADYTTGVNISWEADIWGKIKSRKDVALATLLQSQEGAKAVKTRLVSDIANGYYNLLMLDAQLAVTKKNITLIDSSLLVSRLLRDAGTINTLAVEQLEASREQAASILPQLEQQLNAQENALSILIGHTPMAIRRTSALSNLELHRSLLVDIPVNMVSLRPDIRQAELAVVQAHAMVNVAKTSMYPALNITAQGGLNAFEASNWFKMPGSLFGVATGSLVQPLLQNRKLKTEYEQSKITREQAELKFKQSVLQALGEVANALVGIDKLEAQEDHITKQVQILQDAVKHADMLFENGDASYLEVLTAQSNKLQADLTIAGLQRQRLSAELQLYAALGGGWK